ncbi:E3 ubiquitin/ISG15 ligase TRIM25-like [Discoglossus pictus]
MASADLREELNCSICLSIYTDPVTLTCGHNFCQGCIGTLLETQDGSGVYTCPECRRRFNNRPTLQKNLTLCKIVGHVVPTQPEQEDTGVFCTYCLHSHVPAMKTCLICEASFCDKHMRVHSKSEDHVLIEPTASPKKRKCSIHREILKYYCWEHALCICVSCSLAEEHQGHQVELLNEASEKKKKKLKHILEKLTSMRDETENRLQRLQEHIGEIQEKRVLREITRQGLQFLLQVYDLIHELEIKKDDVCRKICHVEELCNLTDSLTVLQEQESQHTEFSDAENELIERDDLKDALGDDFGLISLTVHRGLADIVTGVNVHEASDILLDVNTAGNYVALSGDLKTAFEAEINQQRPERPERFQCYQVLSIRSFSSGRHYWEVETSHSGYWSVGVCYPTIERGGRQSNIGWNNKSWCLYKYNNWLNKDISVLHDSKETPLPYKSSCQRLVIFLDYEAGRLSFYQLSDQIRHLHTFTATFTEPLHVAFHVHFDGWVRIKT